MKDQMQFYAILYNATRFDTIQYTVSKTIQFSMSVFADLTLSNV